jgi:uncharacterized membrane protein (DUF485 family)
MEDSLTAPVFQHFGSEIGVLVFLIGFVLMIVAVAAAVTCAHLR